MAKPKADDVIPETGPTITQIAHAIPDWTGISGFFGISQPEQTAILAENMHSVNNQRMAFLRKWRSKNGKSATYRLLAELFRQADSTTLSDLVLGCCSDGGSSATPSMATQTPSTSTTHPTTASQPTIKRGDTPTLLQLMAFPVQGGDSLDFTLEIGNSYKKFGIFILNDGKGTTMNTLESQHQKNSEAILNDVFTRWLEGKGSECTWEQLLKCLRQCRCNALADQLQKNLA